MIENCRRPRADRFQGSDLRGELDRLGIQCGREPPLKALFPAQMLLRRFGARHSASERGVQVVVRTDKAGEKKLPSKIADLVGGPLGQVPSPFSDGAAFDAEIGPLDGGRLELDDRCSLEDDSQRSLPVRERQISCGWTCTADRTPVAEGKRHRAGTLIFDHLLCAAYK